MLRKVLIIMLVYVAVLNGVRLQVGGMDIRFEQLVLFFCTLLFATLFFLKRNSFSEIKLRKPEILLLAYWAVLLLSSFANAPDKSYSLVQSFNQLIISFAFFVIAGYANTKENIALYVSHCFNATITISLVGFCFFTISFISGQALYGINLTQNESEAFGIYMTMREPNLWGSYMMGIFFLSLSLLSDKSYSLWDISKLKVQFALICSLLGILLSFTRGVWLATIIGLVIYYFRSLKALLNNLPRLVFFLTFVLFSFYFLKYVAKVDIISYKLNNFLSTEVGTGEGRIIIWGLALENWIQSHHWLLGNGTYSFASFFNTDDYNSGTNSWIGNLYITLLHDTGIIGFILFAIFIFAVVRRRKFVDKIKSDRSVNILRGARLAVITTLISFFFTTGLSLSFCWILFGLAIGIQRYLKTYQYTAFPGTDG